MDPYISVIVTAYNRRQYIRQALDSVRAQTLDKSEYEVVVVSNFEERYEGLNNLRWVTVGDVGLPHMMLIGAEEAKGEVLALLDDDDVWLPHKLRFVRNEFKANNRLGLLHNNLMLADENLRPLPLRRRYRYYLFNAHCKRDYKVHPEGLASKDLRSALGALLRLIIMCMWNTSSQSIRRDVVLAFREAFINGPRFHGTDYMLSLSSLLAGLDIAHVRATLTIYRNKSEGDPSSYLRALNKESEWAYGIRSLLRALGRLNVPVDDKELALLKVMSALYYYVGLEHDKVQALLRLSAMTGRPEFVRALSRELLRREAQAFKVAGSLGWYMDLRRFIDPTLAYVFPLLYVLYVRLARTHRKANAIAPRDSPRSTANP